MSSTDILTEIVSALKKELGNGYSTISHLVTDQGLLLAKQAELIAESRISGSLKDDDALFHFFLDGLETNATNLARSVVMLSALTLEKAWNAIAGILWSAIRGAMAGAGVPGALLPETPPIKL